MMPLNKTDPDYLLGLYEKSMPGTLTVADKLAETAAAGFDYLELSIDESDEKQARLAWSADEILALRRAQESSGVPVKSICLSGHRRFPLGHPDPAVREKSLAIMADAVRLAAALGVRLIQLAGYDVYYEASTPETRASFTANLKRCAAMAAREGVILAFETMETPFMNTVAKAMAQVNAVGSPYLQVYPDVGNVANALDNDPARIRADLESGRGHLAAVHLKETTPGIFREVPYGSGQVDFPAAVATAWRLGVRLYVGEFWDTGRPDWKSILRTNGEFLRDAISRGRTGA
jgi:predicted hexulose-6-phosphate isomerase